MSKIVYTERIVPEREPKGFVANHSARYHFAGQYCVNKKVLEIGSGAGYGAFFLSKQAESVVGIDISAEAVAYANNKYQNDNLIFIEMNAEEVAFENEEFDVICCFEAIEHFDHPEKHLSRVVNLLADDGIYFVSTPNCKKTKSGSKNPYHKWEFDRVGFESLLREHFDEVEILGQYRLNSSIHFLLQKMDIFNLRTKILPDPIRKKTNRLLKTTSIEDASITDFAIGKDHECKWAEFVCICRKPKAL